MSSREDIVRMGKTMLSSGLTLATWGNISCRMGETFCITPSGMDYGTLKPHDIVVMDMAGQVIAGGRRPSTEIAMHRAIYTARPDVGAIIHTHATASTVFAVTGREIPPITDEAAQILQGVVPVAAYALPGTEELAQHIVSALGDKAQACLVRAHGAVCLGKDLESAWLCARVLEQTCEIYRLALSTGDIITPITEDNVEKMTQFLQNSYGQKQS